MNKIEHDFLSWANDPARTLEERYGILRLAEFTYMRYYQGADKTPLDWATASKAHEQRLYNPAYQPFIDEKQLRITAELLPRVEELNLDPIGEDRPLRNLAFLAFVPNVTSLRLHSFEREDLDGFQHLKHLRVAHLRSDEVEDYSALAACHELRELHITTHFPWPVLRALSELPHLEILNWHGNSLALADIPSLPALRSLQIQSQYYQNEPKNSIRDLHQLPDMPMLDHFWGGWFHRLDGIGRFPKLRFLAIRGFFKSLSGLTALTELTHLRITNPRLEEVATVASMPSVRHMAVHSERPQDWGVLMTSETLREVFHLGFDGDQPDLETLRMLIPPWDDLFALPEPRALEPIRVMVRSSLDDMTGADCDISSDFPEGPEGWDGNLGMRQSETWWVENQLHTALRDAGYLKLQGVRMGSNPPELYSLFSNPPTPWMPRRLSLRILKSEAIGHIPGIFECIRKALSQIRHPWQLHVTVQPDADAETWDESWKHIPPKSYAQEMVELEHQLEQKRLRKQIFLKDQHRMRLLQELGEDTEGFKPTPLPAPQENPDSEFFSSPDDGDEEYEEDDKDGGIANFDPEQAANDEVWLSPVDVGDPNSDWNGLFCMFILSEKGVHMHARNRGIESIADLLDVIPERKT
ncbi:MAG: hypothetical protein V4584_12750 [Verrucomicrobiota bacterium]